LKKVARFSPRKNDHQRTTFYHAFTTISPQKNHVLHALFPKHPLKTPAKQQNPGSRQGLIFF
jgi:hypothetical protein